MSQDNQNIIYYLYTAEGQKLQKRIVEQAGSTSKTEYFGGRIYKSGQLKEIAHEEGRILATTTGFEYHYYLRDHLGNVRVEFKQDAYGEAAITQENHYYPFGMRFSGEVFANNDNDFRYNAEKPEISDFIVFRASAKNNKNHRFFIFRDGKEMQGDFGLDWPRFQRDCLSLRFGFAKARQSQASGEYDYGARFYDPVLARFHTQDRLAENYFGLSPYQYTANNLIRFIDVNGDYIYINDEEGDRYKYDHGQHYSRNGDGAKESLFYVILGHEMAHTQDYYLRGTEKVQSKWMTVNGQRIRESEKYATHVENQMRGENRLSLRTHYAINPDGSGYNPSRIIDSKGGSLFYQQTSTYDMTERLILGATPPPIKRVLSITVPFTYK